MTFYEAFAIGIGFAMGSLFVVSIVIIAALMTLSLFKG